MPKFGLLWDLFIQSRKCMSLNFTVDLCAIAMKNDTKTWGELTCRFTWLKLTWVISRILTWPLKNLRNLLFNWLFWPKYIMFELRKVQRSYSQWHWRLMQNLKKNWLVISKTTWGIWQICIGWNKWIAHLTKLFYTCLTESSLFLDLRYKWNFQESCQVRYLSSVFSKYISRTWWLL